MHLSPWFCLIVLAAVSGACAHTEHEPPLATLTGCVEGGQNGQFFLVPGGASLNGVDALGREERYRLTAPDTVPLAVHVNHQVRTTGQVAEGPSSVGTVGASPNGGSPPPRISTFRVSSMADVGLCGDRSR